MIHYDCQFVIVTHIVDGDRCMWTVVFIVLNDAGEITGQILKQIGDIESIVNGVFDRITQPGQKNFMSGMC